MPLDPQVAAYYGDMSGSAGVAALTVGQVRAAMDMKYNDRAHSPAVWAVRDAGIPCPWGVLPVRVYTPCAGSFHPVILFFHGGGFVLHGIASHDSLCRQLCNECGCAVVSVGYRLAPENPFPAAMEDGYTALQWVWDNAVIFGLDRRRIGLAGDSAGGNICSVVSLLSRDRRGPQIAFQILAYSPAGCLSDSESPSMQSFSNGRYVLSKETLGWFSRQYLPAGADLSNPYLNPGRAADLTRLPKTFAVTAEYDPLRDDGEAFAGRLRAAGGEVRILRVPGVMHGFLLLWDRFDAGRRTLGEIGRYVREEFESQLHR